MFIFCTYVYFIVFNERWDFLVCRHFAAYQLSVLPCYPRYYNILHTIDISFNVFINDIFFLDCDCHVYNYADDNSISYSSDTIDTIRHFLTKDINVHMNWFEPNSLKANPKKFQSMLIPSHSCDADGLMIPVGNTIISSMERMKVLGIPINANFIP